MLPLMRCTFSQKTKDKRREASAMSKSVLSAIRMPIGKTAAEKQCEQKFTTISQEVHPYNQQREATKVCNEAHKSRSLISGSEFCRKIMRSSGRVESNPEQRFPCIKQRFVTFSIRFSHHSEQLACLFRNLGQFLSVCLQKPSRCCRPFSSLLQQ